MNLKKYSTTPLFWNVSKIFRKKNGARTLNFHMHSKQNHFTVGVILMFSFIILDLPFPLSLKNSKLTEVTGKCISLF